MSVTGADVAKNSLWICEERLEFKSNTVGEAGENEVV